MANPISNLGLIPNFQIDGLTLTDLTNLVTLNLYTSLRYNQFLKQGALLSAPTQYVVPGGKTFYIRASILQTLNTTTNTNVNFGYSTSAITISSGAYSTNSAPTGPEIFGLSVSDPIVNGYNTTNKNTLNFSGGQIIKRAYPGLGLAIPTGKYVLVDTNDTGGTTNCFVTVFGYEV